MIDSSVPPYDEDPEIFTPLKERLLLMAIEHVFSPTGAGMVVTGTVEGGVIHAGDELEIVGIRPVAKTACLALKRFGKSLKEAEAGDPVEISLSDMQHADMQPGQVLAEPGTSTAHTLFYARIYILAQEEGGRRLPVFNGYKPQFYFREFDISGTLELPNGVEGKPGDTIDNAGVSLLKPVAMDAGLSFRIKEGGRVVGVGTVTATR